MPQGQPHSVQPGNSAWWLARRLAVAVIAVTVAGCASTARVLPPGPGVPFTGYQGPFDEATDACRRVQTMQLAMAINAQSGGERLRGDVLAALARPSSLRLVGVASFGAPGFVLVADPSSAVLVLPRDRRVVEGASADELLGALAGLVLGADDLRAVLTGCVTPDPRPSSARVHDNGWVEVAIDGRVAVYMETVDGVPLVVAGRRPGLSVWYSDHVRGLPRRVDVRAVDVAGVTTNLSATLSQVSINIELNAETFVAETPDDFMPMTLDQFRRSTGPLEAPEAPS